MHNWIYITIGVLAKFANKGKDQEAMSIDELYVIHSKVVTLKKYPNRLKSFIKKEGTDRQINNKKTTLHFCKIFKILYFFAKIYANQNFQNLFVNR